MIPRETKISNRTDALINTEDYDEVPLLPINTEDELDDAEFPSFKYPTNFKYVLKLLDNVCLFVITGTICYFIVDDYPKYL